MAIAQPPEERIVFGADWIVSGSGRYENTLVEGTFVVGDSPGTVVGENQAFGGTVEIRLGGLLGGGAGSQHDQIVDEGQIELATGVDLAILPWNGFVPELGDRFEVMTATAGFTGSVDRVFVDPYFRQLGVAFTVDYTPNVLSVLAVPPLPGDYNWDGVVDLVDYTVWRDTLGATGAYLDADGNGDQVVNQADYDYWKQRLGAHHPSTSAALVRVPEPAAWTLAVLFLAALARPAARPTPLSGPSASSAPLPGSAGTA